VRVVGPLFPHYAILGESDWDLRLGGQGDRRAVVAFARDEQTLLESLKEPGEGVPPNVMRAAVAHRPGAGAAPRLARVDLERPRKEALQQRFFMMFRYDSLDELMEAIDHMEIDVDTIARSRELKNLGSEGWVYWYLFTKGYVQYSRTGAVEEGNVYFDYLVRHYLDHGHDPGARWALAEHDLAVERVARRYQDFDALRRVAAGGPEPPPDTTPVRATVGDWARTPPIQLYEVDADRPLAVRHIDGWHRLCSARLSGLHSYPCEVIPENLHHQPIRGEIEHFAFDGSRLQLSGWSLDPEHLVTFELRGGRIWILARAAPADRPDVAEAFPHIPHARASGFSFDLECRLPADAPVRFDLVVMHEILPVGLLRALHVPGAGVAATTIYELLRPLARRHALDSFGAVLLCQGDGPSLAPAVEHLLPGADAGVTAPDAIGAAAPGAADLVIAHDVLPSLPPAEQRAFLDAVREALRDGGYAAVTVLGELAAEQTRDQVLEACSGALEPADYVEGGVGNLYDLVLLRKS
jgi:hypothetical protein